MAEDRASYLSIFKSTSLFGGVQVFQVLIQIVSTKLVAVLLGPFGVGISNLLSAGLDTVGSVTSLGITKSCVRDISQASSSGDKARVARTVSALWKIVYLTGLLGMAAVLVLCRPLSKWGFGNCDYAVAFAILSVKMLLSQISQGQEALLRGTRRLKDLARISLIGPVLGLFVSVPFYYFMGIRGIVPAMLLGGVSSLAVNTLFARRVKIDKIRLSWKETFQHTSLMLRMGMSFCVAAILSKVCMFVLKGIVSASGGPEAVGLFSSGFNLTNSYVTMIFTAIGMDFYPRLAGAGNNQTMVSTIVNRQGEIAMLILLPVISLGIFYTPLILRVFYSAKFLASSQYVLFAVPGLAFKMASFLLVYQMIARGDSLCYILNEVLSAAVCLFLNIVSYRMWGLSGLGISFTIGYVLYFFQVFFVTKYRYGYSFSLPFLKLFVGGTVVAALCLLLAICLKQGVAYWAGGIVTVVVGVFSLWMLNSRTQLFIKIRNKLYS